MDGFPTATQVATFERTGYLRLTKAFAPELALQIQERMWAELREDIGIDRSDRRTWWQPMRSLRRAKRDPLQDAFSVVEPRGGGTLIVEGSRRLLRQLHAELSPSERQLPQRLLRKRFLRFDPWLEALTGSGKGHAPDDRITHFMQETREVRGVPVRVVELTGEPGDAVLCHPLILPAAAPNRLAVPRFMRSQRICEEPTLGGAADREHSASGNGARESA